MSTMGIFIICVSVTACVAMICYTVYRVDASYYSNSSSSDKYADELRRLQEQANGIYAEVCALKKQQKDNTSED